MFTKETPKELSQLIDMVAAVEDRFRGRFELRTTNRQGERALTISAPDGTGLLYVGVRYDLWLRAQNPMWYGVKTDWDPQVVTSFRETCSEGLIAFESFLLCPVGRSVSSDELIALLENQLRTLCRVLAPGN